jgi:hypothetical protein
MHRMVSLRGVQPVKPSDQRSGGENEQRQMRIDVMGSTPSDSPVVFQEPVASILDISLGKRVYAYEVPRANAASEPRRNRPLRASRS